MNATRRRSAAIPIAITVAVGAALLTGCGSSDDDGYQGVCVDQQTQQRVDDDECDDDHGGHGWVYYRSGSTVPAVGSRANGGVSTVPKGYSSVKGGTPARGGTVARGGFGGSGKGGSVGG